MTTTASTATAANTAPASDPLLATDFVQEMVRQMRALIEIMARTAHGLPANSSAANTKATQRANQGRLNHRAESPRIIAPTG